MQQFEHYAIIHRRLIAGIFFFICSFFILCARLYFLQIIEHQKYITLAEDNRINIHLTLPRRGEIIDRNGVKLAHNMPRYTAILTREQKKPTSVLEAVQSILDLKLEDIRRIKRDLKGKPRHIPITIKDYLSWEEVASLELNLFNLPGIQVLQGYKRYYPLKDQASHILGYVAAPNQKEVKKDKSLMLPGTLVGKNGIEKYYNEILQGVFGQKEVEVDARGRVVRVLKEKEPIEGDPIQLTIDVRLQAFMEEKLHPYQSAAAVVLKVDTGEILGYVSVPGYDPNEFVQGISHDLWNSLRDDPLSPLTNKVIQGTYSPASIFKILVGLAALEYKPEATKKTHTCPGFISLGGHRFHCWKRIGHGAFNLIEAFKKSCDVYFYRLAQEISEKPILRMVNLLQLTDKTGIDLPGETKGLISTPEWKRHVRNESWYPGDTILLSIGQGSTHLTPLQTAQMLAIIVNGGKRITPHLWKNKPFESVDLGISAYARGHIMKGLDKAVNEVGGTGYSSRITTLGQEMGGKTATAQVRRISMAERKTGVLRGENLPRHQRDHSLFIGYAPVKNPQFVAFVIVEHGGWGSKTAAPLVRDILQKTQELWKEEGKKV